MSIQNVEAEQTVIGSLLLEGELIKECRLTEHHFSTALHQAIFKLIREVEEGGQPLDLVTLVSKMDPSFLAQIGGIEYFVNMIESVPTTANFAYYEGLVRSAWKMRRAGMMGHSMCERLLADKDEKVIGETITALCELEEVDCTLDFELKDVLVDLYEEFHQDVEELTGIETGFSTLNKMTCGLQDGEFVVIGARPSMGNGRSP